jgi:DNA-binding TFAR19-related protein (PDSD5 family)
MDDEELKKLKLKRLEEMQRQLLLKQLQTEAKQEKKKLIPIKEPTNKEILESYFKDRAGEVWNEAKSQYPQIIPQLEELLIDAIKQKKIQNYITGSSLMGFFRQIGLHVRLHTKIRISEHGELKTLEQKIKENRE